MRPWDPNERIAYLQPAAFPGAELLIASGSRNPWHVFHERYAFCACRVAGAGWRYRGREYYLEDGGVMLLEPGEVHRNTVVHKPAAFKVMLIPAALLQNLTREMGTPATVHFLSAQSEDPRLLEAIYGFCGAVESGASALEQQSWLVAAVRRFLEYAEKRPPALAVAGEHPSVERAKAYLCERFDEAVSLDELSAAARLSPFHLLRAFTRRTGLPPHAFQIHVRIAHARALLQSGMTPVDVANRVGFADQSHLTRHFRQIWRVTPGEYAQAVRTRSAGPKPVRRRMQIRAALP